MALHSQIDFASRALDPGKETISPKHDLSLHARLVCACFSIGLPLALIQIMHAPLERCIASFNADSYTHDAVNNSHPSRSHKCVFLHIPSSKSIRLILHSSLANYTRKRGRGFAYVTHAKAC